MKSDARIKSQISLVHTNSCKCFASGRLVSFPKDCSKAIQSGSVHFYHSINCFIKYLATHCALTAPPPGLSSSAAFCVFLGRNSQLTCRCVPALADTASFTAVWSLYSPQLQGSARSHEMNDVPFTTHTAQRWLFGVPSPTLLLKQGYLFSYLLNARPHFIIPVCLKKKDMMR